MKKSTKKTKSTKNAKLKAKMNKIKFYNYLLGFFSLTFIMLLIMVGLREYRSYKYSNEAISALEAFQVLSDVEGSNVNFENADVKIGKYKIIGSIKIDSIGLHYPILEKTTEESMLLSLTKLSGPNLNSIGNVSIAGHNAHNGTLFSKLSNVNIDDIIEITDSKNNTIQYKIYKIYSVAPNDLSPLRELKEDIREVTLVSCIMNAKKRIIVKAIEIKEN